MSNIAISVRNISKKFRLFNSPKERLIEALHPFRKQYHHEFWALRDVSFDIEQGETIGILGRNGSGKSTLLQIICSVMKLTQGVIQTQGRISALLELGAGFNPEFTGRDNVILNGAIMGIPRKEMLQRLPQVEAFADIGEFFMQPVKTYSSGMYARLAFACSINVDPDILVVDEALAVGDAKFQNKCFMHFKNFQAKGKTIIFVSHSTEAILRNCTSALLMDGGELIMQGKPQDAVDKYYELLFPSEPTARNFLDQQTAENKGHYEELSPPNLTDLLDIKNFNGSCELRNSYNKDEFRYGDKEVVVADYILVVGDKIFPNEIQSGAQVTLYIKLKVNDFNGLLSVGFAVKTVDGVKLFGTNTISNGIALPPVVPGDTLWVRFSFFMNVGSGDIFMDLGCGDWSTPPARPLDRRHSVIHLVVSSNGKFDGLSNCFGSAALVDVIPTDMCVSG
jgi:lipopolysaccharide transport system ATP-binding protein